MTTDPSAVPGPSEPGSLATLRAAAGRLDALSPDSGFDPGEHAERFEAVHDALVAVLADVETGAGSGPGTRTEPGPGTRTGTRTEQTPDRT